MTETQSVDPVCGMALASWDCGLDRTYAGTNYHFCAPQCAARFAKKPERYTRPGSRPVMLRARERVTLPIFGLGCGGGGSITVERQLLRTPGVLWAYVNPATEMAYIRYHSGLVTHDDLVDVIEELGYRSLRAVRRQRSKRTDVWKFGRRSRRVPR
jgi:YHS domain-containing protein/copper chaperone CopZ